MSNTRLGSNLPFGTRYNQYVGTAETVSSDSNKFGSGAVKGKLLDKQLTQDIFTKGFGVELETKGTEIKLTGKNLSKSNLAALKESNAPFKALREFTNASNKGWTLLDKTSVSIAAGDYDTFVKGAASNTLEGAGITASKSSKGALKLSVNGPVTDAQKSLLKKAGISSEAIEELGKSGSSVVKNVTHENFITKVGKQEVSKMAKACGVTVEEVTTRGIKAGTSEIAKKIGLKSATLYQNVASKFGKEVTKEAVEKFGATAGKSVGKMGAFAARGAAGVPVAGVLVMSAFEIPNLVSAYKNGGVTGLVRQTCKSIGNMGASTVGSVIGSAVGGLVGTLIPIPGATLAGMWIGEAIGGIAGYTVGQKLTDGLFGETQKSTETNNTTETNTDNSGVSGFITDMSFMDPYVQPYGGTIAKKTTELL